jgi:hypothetical protein
LVSGQVSYTQEELLRVFKAGFVPAIFSPTQVFPYERGDFLVFQLDKKLPHDSMQRLFQRFNGVLNSLGLRAIFIPPDVNFLGKITPKDEQAAQELSALTLKKEDA